MSQFHRLIGLPEVAIPKVRTLDHQNNMTTELKIALSSYRSIWRKGLL